MFFVQKLKIKGISLKNRQKMNFSLCEMYTFREKFEIFLTIGAWKLLKNCQNFWILALVMSIFRLEIENWKISKNCQKWNFSLWKMLNFVQNLLIFREKSLSFPKICQKCCKQFKFLNLFFQKTWIFSGELKIFENLLFWVKKMKIHFKNLSKIAVLSLNNFKIFAFFWHRKSEKKQFQKSLNLT